MTSSPYKEVFIGKTEKNGRRKREREKKATAFSIYAIDAKVFVISSISVELFHQYRPNLIQFASVVSARSN